MNCSSVANSRRFVTSILMLYTLHGPKPFRSLRFKQYGLALDVPISYVDVGDAKQNLPWIKPTDMFEHLAQLDKLNVLYAEQEPSVLTQPPGPTYGSLQPPKPQNLNP